MMNLKLKIFLVELKLGQSFPREILSQSLQLSYDAWFTTVENPYKHNTKVKCVNATTILREISWNCCGAHTNSLIDVVHRDMLENAAPIGSCEMGPDPSTRHNINAVLGVVQWLQHRD